MKRPTPFPAAATRDEQLALLKRIRCARNAWRRGGGSLRYRDQETGPLTRTPMFLVPQAE